MVKASNSKIRAIAALPMVLILLAACSRGPKDTALVERGKKLLEKKDYARAALEFRSAIQANSKNAEAEYELALAELGLGDKVSAYRALTRALDLNPKHDGAQLQMANLLITSSAPEDVKEAEAHAQSVLEGSPDNPDALDAMAVAELRLGNRDQALKLLEQATSKAPGHLQSAVELSLTKLGVKDTAGAQKILEKAVENAPDSLQARVILGAFYLMVGKLPDGEQQFRLVLQKDPNNIFALFNLATELASIGRNFEAEEMYRRLANQPASPYRFSYAAHLFRTGKQKEAVTELERLAKLDPKDTNARTRLVAAYIATKRIADAQKLLGAALHKNPKDTAALLQRSDLKIEAGDYEDARQDLNSILHSTPTSAEAHFLMSGIYRAEGKPLQQRQELAETVRLAPRSFAARLALAQSYLTAGDGLKAREIIDQTPDEQRGLRYIEYRNWALLTSGDLKEAQKGITDGLAKAKTRDLLMQDALLKLRQGNPGAGRSRLIEVLKGNPEDLGALDVLIRSDAAQKQLASAIEAVRMLISERPKSAALQYRLGMLLAATHHVAEARAAYLAAVAADSQFAPARLALASLDQSEGKPDAARQDLDPVLTSKSGGLLARSELGFVQAKAGDYSDAIENLRKVVETRPTDVVALNNLAYLLADQTDQTDEALRYAQRAKELAPNDINVEGTIGWVYFRKGIYESALRELKDAVDREGKSVTEGAALRRYHLAMAYAKTGDAANATKVLSDALTIDPKLPESRIATTMIGKIN